MNEPNYPALLHFAHKKGDDEYVVIAEEGPISEHCRPGFECRSVCELDDLPTSFPTDRALVPNLMY